MMWTFLFSRQTTARLAWAAVLAAAAVALLPKPGEATDETWQYCFYSSTRVNVLTGTRETGFKAHPADRPGRSQTYRRVGTTNRYVGDTGAIYTLFDNGDATWSDGRQIIRLYRCD